MVGYENRLLKQEDFNNDNVDAAISAPATCVTALYEIIPAGQPGWLGESRYRPAAPAADSKAGEYAHVNLRYKLPGKSSSILISQPVAANSKPLAQANADTRFAIAVAAYGQQLRGGQYNGKRAGATSSASPGKPISPTPTAYAANSSSWPKSPKA